VRLSVGDLVVLDRDQYAQFETEAWRLNFPESEELLTRIFNQSHPAVGIVLKKWVRESLVSHGSRSKIRVLTYVDVAWPDGHCTCPSEVLSSIKRSSE
jgi:hypothetical protein